MNSFPAGDAELHVAVSALMAEFCWRVDRAGGVGIADLFTPEARLIISGAGKLDERTEGREALAARWSDRAADYVTRHVFTNLRITRSDSNMVTAESVGIGFRHIGPSIGSTAPLVVADYEDQILLCPDGRWRFSERRVSVIFADSSLVN